MKNWIKKLDLFYIRIRNHFVSEKWIRNRIKKGMIDYFDKHPIKKKIFAEKMDVFIKKRKTN